VSGSGRESTEIRRTRLSDCEVMIAKLDDAHVIRPFQVFVEKRGVVGHRSHFSCLASAEQHFGALVAAYEEPR
jgi:hypothetical protein